MQRILNTSSGWSLSRCKQNIGCVYPHGELCCMGLTRLAWWHDAAARLDLTDYHNHRCFLSEIPFPCVLQCESESPKDRGLSLQEWLISNSGSHELCAIMIRGFWDLPHPPSPVTQTGWLPFNSQYDLSLKIRWVVVYSPLLPPSIGVICTSLGRVRLGCAWSPKG